MNDQTPKIVNLADRSPYRELNSVPPGEADPATIAALEEALRMAHAGELHGLIAIGFDPIDKEFWRHITLPPLPGFEARNSAALMLGAIQMVQDDLKDIAFWTQGYDPLCMYPVDEPEPQEGDQ